MIPPVFRGSSSCLCHDSGAGSQLPFPAPLAPHQILMFGSPSGSGGYYNDGIGLSLEPKNLSQASTVVVTDCESDSPSLALGPGNGPNQTQVITPSKTAKTGVGFQPYVPKK